MRSKGDSLIGRTRWIDGQQRPSAPGVYPRHWPGGPFSRWDGELWRGDAFTRGEAADAVQASRHQSAAWRGEVLRFPTAKAAAEKCRTCGGHGVVDSGSDDEAGWAVLRECLDC